MTCDNTGQKAVQPCEPALSPLARRLLAAHDREVTAHTANAGAAEQDQAA